MMEEQMPLSTTLTIEEQSRMHPWTKAKCVMMSDDSSVFPTRSSHQSPGGYDLPDEARPGHIIPIIPLSTARKFNHDQHVDAEAIEQEGRETKRMEVSSIAVEKLLSTESRPKIHRNSVINGNIMMNKTYMNYENDDDNDDACVKCIYVTQQCCECVIT